MFSFPISSFLLLFFLFFFFNDTATTEIYTLSLHDALPISPARCCWMLPFLAARFGSSSRSEEHTSELQSRPHLVCRLLLEKKKNQKKCNHATHNKKKSQRERKHAPKK